MIFGPKEGYIKALCIESFIFIDDVWGDCSIKEGLWYNTLMDNHMCTEEYLMVGFGKYPNICLVPYKKNMFKTESQLRDDKLNEILKK